MPHALPDPATLLVTLVGEQPIPPLIALRMLRPERALLVVTSRTRAVGQRVRDLVDGRVGLVEIDEPHRLDLVREALEAGGSFPEGTVVDLTGGTKPMALALATLAQSGNHAFPVRAAYLRTERFAETLDVYTVQERFYSLRFTASYPTPPLLTADEYVRAHVGPYTPPDRHVALPAAWGLAEKKGVAFERAVVATLREAGYDLLDGIRLPGGGNQQEADLVVVSGNRAAVVEVKMSGSQKPKQGLDQLVALAKRETLGTYVRRALVLANALHPRTAELARVQQVEIIDRVGGTYRAATDQWPLSAEAKAYLISRMHETVGPPGGTDPAGEAGR